MTPAVTVGRGVVYSAPEGFRPLELDVYRPAADAPRPAIVWLHGGGWRRGSRTHLPGAVPATLLHDVAAAGYVVLAADYRLSGEATFPAQAEDVSALLGWTWQHAAEHGIDANRIVVWGESAGAHLALIAALSHPGIAGAVAWYPPTDLAALPDDVRYAGGEADESRETALLGGRRAAADCALTRAASPVHLVHAAAPPILLQHGDADVLVPAQQSQRLAAALRDVGARVQLELVPDAGHMWRGATDVDAVISAAMTFVAGLVSG